MAVNKERIALKKFSDAVLKFEVSLDAEMMNPSTKERGERIAGLLNSLSYINQGVMHFTFGLTFKQIANRYAKYNTTPVTSRKRGDA